MLYHLQSPGVDAVALIVAVVEADRHPDPGTATRKNIGLCESDARDDGAVVERAREVVEAPVARPGGELHPHEREARRAPRGTPGVDHRAKRAAVRVARQREPLVCEQRRKRISGWVGWGGVGRGGGGTPELASP